MTQTPDDSSLDVPAADALEQSQPAAPDVDDSLVTPGPLPRVNDDANEADVLEQSAVLPDDEEDAYPPES
jgi:hypothetical protein